MILNEKLICTEYIETKMGIEKLALKYHVGKKKIINILNKNNIKHKNKGGQNNSENFIIKDWKIKKYINNDKEHYIVIDNKTGYVSNDIENKGGHLTTYIKNTYNIVVPSLYYRRLYYMTTGNYWWEQWLTVKKVNNIEKKQCPFCNWHTQDIHNKSGAFEQHLKRQHNITKFEYIKQFPNDKDYFILANKTLNRELEIDGDKYVICQICGRKLSRISNSHLKKHNITKDEYIVRYGSNNLYCNEYKNKLIQQSKILNTIINSHINKFTSKAEQEIKDFIISLGFNCSKNRGILEGQELDIFIPSKNIAIEYNGNKWHTENFGKKDKFYHLNKLEKCKQKGIKLISIFEDEWLYKKEIIKRIITDNLEIKYNLDRVECNDCKIKFINHNEAIKFINENNIEDYKKSEFNIGAIYEDNIIGLISFNIQNSGNLLITNITTNINFDCNDIIIYLFNYIKEYYKFNNINFIVDKRWDICKDLLGQIGFKVQEIILPDYKYYIPCFDRYKRYDKKCVDNITKSTQIQYDKIWDCGYVKYLYG